MIHHLAVLIVLLLTFGLPVVYLGNIRGTNQPFNIPLESYRTHWHLIGGTGKGKTTAIEAMLHQLLPYRHEKACYVLVDRMGSFSFSLLRWFSSRFCPEWVRRRLVYIEPSREDVIIPFNPLVYDTPAHGYFKVGRAVECILRAWASQNVEEMPRLSRWVFNAFWAAAQLGLTIADCIHFLMPGSPYHARLLSLLPPLLRAEWAEITNARGGEASRILESTRNRLKPYFENALLRHLFGSTQNRLDMLRFMREGKIVLINLAPQNRLSPQIADAIGGMVINEVLATARSLPMGVRYPTYLWLDEFQRFVGPDTQEAIPEVRQLGIRLLLSHQSFSQLRRGDVDLSSLIWQCQSRMMFGVQGEDADLLAHEIASLTFDPMRIKDETYTRRQLLKEHQIGYLASWTDAVGEAQTWSETVGSNWNTHTGFSQARSTHAADSTHRSFTFPPGGGLPTRTEGAGHMAGSGDMRGISGGDSQGGSKASTTGGGTTRTQTYGVREQLIPVYDEFLELANRTYSVFDEQSVLCAQEVRRLRTGQTLVRLVNTPGIEAVDVQRSAPGLLDWDVQTLLQKNSRALDAVFQLIEENFRQDCFLSPRAIEIEAEQRLQAVLYPVTELRLEQSGEKTALPQKQAEEAQEPNPFDR